MWGSSRWVPALSGLHLQEVLPLQIACMHCNSDAGRAHLAYLALHLSACMGMLAHSDPRRRICRWDRSSIECLSTGTTATGGQTCMLAVVRFGHSAT